MKYLLLSLLVIVVLLSCGVSKNQMNAEVEVIELERLSDADEGILFLSIVFKNSANPKIDTVIAVMNKGKLKREEFDEEGEYRIEFLSGNVVTKTIWVEDPLNPHVEKYNMEDGTIEEEEIQLEQGAAQIRMQYGNEWTTFNVFKGEDRKPMGSYKIK